MKSLFTTAILILAYSVLTCSYTSPSGYVVLNDHNYYSDFNIYNNDVMILDFVQGTLCHSLSVDYIVNELSEINEIPVRVSLSGFPEGEYSFKLWLDKQRVEGDTLKTWDAPVEFSFTNLSFGIHELTVEITDSTDVVVVNDVLNFAVYERNTVWRNSNGDRIVLMQSGIPGPYQEIRPVLFLEGFPIFDDSTYMSSLISTWSNSLSLTSNVYQLILNDGMRDLRDNAMVALAAIVFVHEHLPYQLKEGTSVFGYSMGGILARYALAYAEANNIEHYCSQYISLDAPHKGAALNENMQRMIEKLEDWLDDNRFYINLYNMFNPNDYDPDIIDPYISKLSSTAAKQLFRANKWATGDHDYVTGSATFRALFSELDGDYGPLPNVLNYDPSYPADQMKPGFPYKQNNIKCFAYSNGSLLSSGNKSYPQATIVSSYFISFKIMHWPWSWTSSDTYSASYLEYDTQPGSVFQDLRNFDGFPTPGKYLQWIFTQNYAPVIVPTRSSLGLSVDDVINPNNPVENFAMSNFYDITESHSTLLNHTFFDSIVHSPSPNDSLWQWQHGDIGSSWVQTNISTTVNWMNDIAQRAIGYIEGNLIDSDPSSVGIMMFVNGFLDYTGFAQGDGSFKIPYKCTNNSLVKLVFHKPNYLMAKDLQVNYQNGLISYPPIADATMIPFNFGNIVVSQDNQYFFNNVSSVVSFLAEYMNLGLYNGEAIVIKVMSGIYYESIDLSPLADNQISSLTLKGWGTGVVIDAELNGPAILV